MKDKKLKTIVIQIVTTASLVLLRRRRMKFSKVRRRAGVLSRAQGWGFRITGKKLSEVQPCLQRHCVWRMSLFSGRVRAHLGVCSIPRGRGLGSKTQMLRLCWDPGNSGPSSTSVQWTHAIVTGTAQREYQPRMRAWYQVLEVKREAVIFIIPMKTSRWGG